LKPFFLVCLVCRLGVEASSTATGKLHAVPSEQGFEVVWRDAPRLDSLLSPDVPCCWRLSVVVSPPGWIVSRDEHRRDYRTAHHLLASPHSASSPDSTVCPDSGACRDSHVCRVVDCGFPCAYPELFSVVCLEEAPGLLCHSVVSRHFRRQPLSTFRTRSAIGLPQTTTSGHVWCQVSVSMQQGLPHVVCCVQGCWRETAVVLGWRWIGDVVCRRVA